MYELYQPGWHLPTSSFAMNYAESDRQDIRGENFVGFIDLCFDYASHFSLAEPPPWPVYNDEGLKDALEPFKVASIRPPRWFRYTFLKNETEVSIYRACEESKRILLDHYWSLMLHRNRTGEEVTSAPTLENLCFFADDKLFLGCVAHAMICDVMPPDEAFERKMSQFADWVAVKDDSMAHVNLSDFL
jgi:hypothetical protein